MSSPRTWQQPARAAVLAAACAVLAAPDAPAQTADAHGTADFRLVSREVQLPGRTIRAWELCLSQYTVEVAGKREWIPIFPIWEPVQFVNTHARAVDALERVSNALGDMARGERLTVLPAPQNAPFQGSALWTVPRGDQDAPGLILRISEQDVRHFGFRANDSAQVAQYIKDIFEAMSRLFLRHGDPTSLDALQKYPEAKVLKKIWLNARQHAEMTRNVPRERSAQAVTREDIQEVLDMLGKEQRRRLLGMCRLLPHRGPERNR